VGECRLHAQQGLHHNLFNVGPQFVVVESIFLQLVSEPLYVPFTSMALLNVFRLVGDEFLGILVDGLVG